MPVNHKCGADIGDVEFDLKIGSWRAWAKGIEGRKRGPRRRRKEDALADLAKARGRCQFN